MKLLNGKFDMDMLVITKSLRGYYKNPDQIAHKVLADRMGERDPGNKPSSNDRIPYAYIDVKESRFCKVLQGDRIEHPDFIIENNLKPDYKFYITNQIMKPVTQIFSLLLNDMKEFKGSIKKNFEKKLEGIKIKYRGDIEKIESKTQVLKDKMVKQLIFDDALRICNNTKNNQPTISSFFNKK